MGLKNLIKLIRFLYLIHLTVIIHNLGKLFSQCASVTKQYNLVPANGRWCSAAEEVTAGLAESNSSLVLPPGLWLRSPAGWLPRTRISSGTLRSLQTCDFLSFYLSTTAWVSRYRNVSVLAVAGAKDDGGGDGDNWNYKTRKAPVQSSPPTDHHHRWRNVRIMNRVYLRQYLTYCRL